MSASGVIPVERLQPRDLAAWRELAAAAVEPNPFFEPECVLPATRHLGESGISLLVVHGSGGEWIGCMPVSSRLRLRRRTLPTLTAWRHRYCFLGTPLIAAGAVEVATEGLVEQAIRASHIGVVALPRIGDDGPVAAGLRAALQTGGRRAALHRSYARAVMHRSSLGDGVTGVISARHRRDLGRLGRRLAEEVGGPLLLRDESQDPAAVERFLALEGAGWKGKAGTAMICRSGDAQFFRELCDGFRAAGRFELISFGTGERLVSARCSLLAADTSFGVKTAFDEVLARYRPGVQMELQILERFVERHDYESMDSCAETDSTLFEYLWHDRRVIGTYVLAANRALGWTIDHGAAAFARHHAHGDGA